MGAGRAGEGTARSRRGVVAMSRGAGRLFRPVAGDGHESDVWWLDYTIGKKRYRVSSKTTVKREAQDQLRTQIGDRKDGRIIGRPDRVTLHELRTLHETQYD